ncbi:hypothetical protein [Streptomyces sp. S.PNR 29]|uniref:hypothetical protein n=1 Tax=Streptomyces sp. S.PNR 29 TaxID=2973805 RepID=UPI0025B11A9F|nr:hypothetical protein [Streptomyces sp. S.PNR 29]MDN0195972.1 hypothetical protein [Streptomyces sp. S.PNR 29]
MSWTRGLRAVLAVCVLLLTGSAGCGAGDAREQNIGATPSPMGRLLDDTDQDGRQYRDMGDRGAPGVGIEVQPGADGAWEVRLTVRDFRLSPTGTKAEAGRGVAYLYVDGDLVARLRTPEYRLAARLVPRGTHHVTARLYADDGTVWAVDGKPVECTADITASRTGPEPEATGSTAGSAAGVRSRAGGHRSPDRGGKAS